MLSDIFNLIKNDKRSKYLLFAGFIIQILFCITGTGAYHTDQHFQIIEFSTWHSGEPSGVPYVWEFTHHVRPTLQIWMFSAWHKAARLVGLTDPYLELTILRLVLGICMFIVFNAMTIYYLKTKEKYLLHFGLLLLNFSWFLPYTRTLFSSEMVSALLFFGTAWLYDVKKDRSPKFLFLFLTGLLLALSFYLRFQTGFFIAGFGTWMIFQKKYRHILPVSAGFILGFLLNLGLDYKFYDHFVVTPYEYFAVNIFSQRAASFGTSSPFTYVGVLLALTPVIPVSLFLYYYAGKSLKINYRHLLFLTFFFFFIGHSLVGHKEERFMFPVLNVMPIILAWGIPEFRDYYIHCKKWIRNFLKSMIVLSIVLNSVLLVLLLFNPYCQTIAFTSRLQKKFKGSDSNTRIYCLDRSPFETPSKIPFRFYEKSFRPRIIKIDHKDSIRSLSGSNIYFTATYDQIQNHRKMIDSLGFKPVLYSSPLLWKVNEFLYSREIHTINDIWVLYRK
jgi:phosphatidylinositol glycan class B